MFIKADFESGNVANVRKVAKNHFAIEARKDVSPKPLWFYFKIGNNIKEKIIVDLINADECLCYNLKSWNFVQPVYSYDRKRWQRMSLKNVRFDEDKRIFQFSKKFARDNVWVAFCYPYTYSDLKNYLRKIRENRYVKIEKLGKTAEGKNLYLLKITDFSEDNSKKFGIWITARCHSGEVTGSYALEGLINYLLSRKRSLLRKNFFFNVVPMIDIDGVYNGRYGKDSAPRDFCRDWREKPIRPEIKLIKNKINEWAKKFKYDLFLDFHAPCPENINHIHRTNPSFTDTKYEKEMLKFMKIVAENAPDQIRANDIRSPDYMGENFKFCSFGNQYFSYGVISIAFEFSYHRIYTGKCVTQEMLRRYGGAIAKSIGEYFKC